jgi:hypothetical protein
MGIIRPPASVLAAFLRHPLRLPDGRTLYALHTRQGRFFSVAPPDIFDASGTPITLAAELAAGSLVRVAITNRFMIAVQIVEARYDNPFADASR